MQRLRSLLKWYLLLSGIFANLALVVCFSVIGAVGIDGLRAAARDGIPGLARAAVAPIMRLERYRAERVARALGLRTTDDAFAFTSVDVPLDVAHGHGRILRVGPSRPYTVPSQAAAVAAPGDIVEIDPGDYRGDSTRWHTSNLVIRGAGGVAHMDGTGVTLVQHKAIWLIQADNVRVEHIEFSGAVSRDRNGAAIRAEGDRLHVVACFFHDNETGILSNPVVDGSLRVEHSEFARNGHADGQAHQIYISRMREFVLRYNYIHDTVVGSAVKSRAEHNHIAFNRIVDGAGGSSNYSLDLSNGGVAYVIGNAIEQGPHTNNSTLIAFAPEGARALEQELFVVHNTLVNDRHSGLFLHNFSSGTAFFYNNLLLGDATALRGRAIAAGNVSVRDGWSLFADDELGGSAGSHGNRTVTGRAVTNRASLDYRLSRESPAIDAGVEVAEGDALNLRPHVEYLHPSAARARAYRGAPDAGAYEFAP